MSKQNYGHRHDDDEKSFLSYEEHLAKESLNFPTTFGYYKNLVNEKVPNEFSVMNDWFFTEFSKISIVKFGFVSVIRYLHEDTLYLKLYYLSDIIRGSEREIDDFVCAFYAHGKFELEYSKCNILRIPLEQPISAESIEKLTNIKDLEFLLQSQLNGKSWIGVYPSGTMGSFTHYNPNQPLSIYNKWKSLLFEGYLELGYEDRLKQEEMESNSKNNQKKGSTSSTSTLSAGEIFWKELKEQPYDNSWMGQAEVMNFSRTLKKKTEPTNDGTTR